MKNRTMDIFELVCLELRDQGRITQGDVVNMRDRIKEIDHYKKEKKIYVEDDENFELILPGLRRLEEE